MIKFPSVLRDFRGFLPEAVSSLSDLTDETTLEDWAALTESKEQAMSCIRRYLNLEEGKQVSKPKTYRLATKRLLVALDHALAISIGKGLGGLGLQGVWFAPSQRSCQGKGQSAPHRHSKGPRNSGRPVW